MKTQSLYGTIVIQSDTDTYSIFQVDAIPNETTKGFGVTSKGGIDTVGNGLVFPTIQKAMGYVNQSIKNNG